MTCNRLIKNAAASLSFPLYILYIYRCLSGCCLLLHCMAREQKNVCISSVSGCSSRLLFYLFARGSGPSERPTDRPERRGVYIIKSNAIETFYDERRQFRFFRSFHLSFGSPFYVGWRFALLAADTFLSERNSTHAAFLDLIWPAGDRALLAPPLEDLEWPAFITLTVNSACLCMWIEFETGMASLCFH